MAQDYAQRTKKARETALVGSGVIGDLKGAGLVSESKADKARENYANFIASAIETLESQGIRRPQNKEELIVAVKAICELVWTKFENRGTNILDFFESFGEKWTADCDTSAILIGDILKAFGHGFAKGMECHIANARTKDGLGHSLLCVKFSDQSGQKSIYFETTSGMKDYKLTSYEHGQAAKEYKIITEEIFSTHMRSFSAEFGNVLFNKKDWDSAIRYYRQALEFDPDDRVAALNIIAAYRNMGKCMLDSKKWAKAREAYSELIRYMPNNANAYFQLGYISKQEGKYDEAVKWYKKVMELDPKKADACNNLGTIYGKRNDWIMAAAYFSKALEIEPANLDYMENLAAAYNNIGLEYGRKKDYENAIVYYSKARELDSENKKYIQNLASAYNNIGIRYGNDDHDWNNAVSYFTKAIELDPNNPVYYQNRAAAYSNLGYKDLAEADKAKARRLG